jgi:argininosuccinate lyase
MADDTRMWGGRFAQSTADEMQAFSESVSFDRALYREDIIGSKAHARMLARIGVLTTEEANYICEGLDRIRAEIEAGEFTWSIELEDVHMNIERRLTELIGDAGKKLHTGRSRNDQIALDFRLHVAASLSVWQTLLHRVVEVLAQRADEHRATLLPGYTHLQPAQPVSLAQHLLAYAQMFMRDHERCADALKRVQVSPLGAGALAGTTFPVEPKFSASQVGFPESFANSMDAVSDRDFAAEALFTAALAAMHLSRLCEEIILWANPGFGFVTLPDAFATGSSIMPQKKNPDAAEIMRGKTGRVYGNLVSLLTTLKGLPLTYNRDLQEDKEPFFDSDRTIRACLSIMAAMLGELEFETEAMREALSEGFLNATELADYLVARGMPFREAHHAAGQAVALAEARDVELDELSLSDLQKIAEEIEDDVFDALDYETAVSRRNAPGGTGPRSVVAQLDAVGAWLAKNGGQDA